MYPLKQSSALTVPFFAHDVNGDGVTGLVDAGFTKRISKNGAAFAAMTVTITEMENGWYSLPLSTAHTDTLGILTVSISHASTKRVNLQFRVHARINDDLAYPAVSGRSSAIDASGRALADVDTIKTQAVTASGGITFPAATLASTVNITAASGIAVSSLGANVITAASINAAALNGKGDWNVGKTGYSLTATTGLGNQTANITGNLSGSVGSVTGAVGSVTADVGITQAGADKVWGTTTRQLTATQVFNNTGTWTGNLTGSVGSVTGAVGSVTGAVGSVTAAVTVGALNANVIDAASIAAGALNGKGDWNIGKTGYSILAADKDVLVDLVWDEVLTGATHNVNASSGKRLRQLADTVLVGDTAQGGTATSITLHAGASDTDDIYAGALVAIIGGTGVGQSRLIVSYNGTTKVAKVAREWKVNPFSDSEFIILAHSPALRVEDGEAQAGASGSITLAATASSVNETYTGMKATLTAGTGAGQARIIASYNGTSKVATVQENWTTPPDNTTIYAIQPVGRAFVTRMADDVISASALSAGAANKQADHVLRRTYANARQSADGDAVAFRSLLGGVGKLVNRWQVSGGVLTVFQEDDLTSSAPGGTQNVTATVGANPITQLDTV